MCTARNSILDVMLNKYPAVRIISLFILPYIILFSLYVQFNGEDTPGGGFQAGVIFASAIVSYALLYSAEKVRQLLSVEVLLRLAALGTIIYAGLGVVTLLLGENFLDYYALPLTKTTAQRLGIMIVELGVGLTVAAAMILIYLLFAE